MKLKINSWRVATVNETTRKKRKKLPKSPAKQSEVDTIPSENQLVCSLHEYSFSWFSFYLILFCRVQIATVILAI